MKWEALLARIAHEPVFSSPSLLAGEASATLTRIQLSRWVNAGRLLQLRRGLYALAPLWRKVEPHPFLVANSLQTGSYVSLHSALAFHGIIPEHPPVVTSVGPGRPGTLRNPLGVFHFNHLAGRLLFGNTRLEVAPRQFALVATPEKALLDLLYLTPHADSDEYMARLRLPGAHVLKLSVLGELAERSGKPKLVRAAGKAWQVVLAAMRNHP